MNITGIIYKDNRIWLSELLYNESKSLALRQIGV
jgi:hypothetical protein